MRTDAVHLTDVLAHAARRCDIMGMPSKRSRLEPAPLNQAPRVIQSDFATLVLGRLLGFGPLSRDLAPRQTDSSRWHHLPLLANRGQAIRSLINLAASEFSLTPRRSANLAPHCRLVASCQYTPAAPFGEFGGHARVFDGGTGSRAQEAFQPFIICPRLQCARRQTVRLSSNR